MRYRTVFIIQTRALITIEGCPGNFPVVILDVNQTVLFSVSNFCGLVAAAARKVIKRSQFYI